MNAVRADQQAAQVAVLAGGDVEWPTLEERLEEFEAELVAEPVALDPEELELRSALGLRGGGGRD